jgi:hypothetical protein
VMPCIGPVFACGALDRRGTSFFGGGLSAFGKAGCCGWGLEGEGGSVDDADEERWWEDADEGGREAGEERIEVHWVRNARACFWREKVW